VSLVKAPGRTYKELCIASLEGNVICCNRFSSTGLRVGNSTLGRTVKLLATTFGKSSAAALPFANRCSKITQTKYSS
jgi:hypothetical protein